MSESESDEIATGVEGEEDSSDGEVDDEGSELSLNSINLEPDEGLEFLPISMEPQVGAMILGGVRNGSVPNDITRVEIDQTDYIGHRAFMNLTALKIVVLHQGLKGILERAFFGCTSLTTISIPSSVTEIGNHAFNSCESLKEIPLSEGLEVIGAFAFYRCHRLEELSVPSTTTTIRTFAFSACTSLVSVEFQPGLKRIEKAAFCRCSSLSTISIPSSVELIGTQAFSGCSGLLNLELPAEAGDLWLSKWAFKDCESLVNVAIPRSYYKNEIDYSFFKKAFAGTTFRFNQVGGTNDPLLLLRDRYKKLPIHNVCSCLCDGPTEFEDVLVVSFDSSQLLDCFGMTPFHALATSAKIVVLDYFYALLEYYSADLITAKDQRGNTMIDYLLIQGPSKALPLLQLVLQRTLVDGIHNWGLPRWKSTMEEKVNAFRWEGGVRARRERFSAIQTTFGSYTNLEKISLLELALWKRRIQSVDREHTKRQKKDRDALRTICGSDVVIGHVAKFLVDPSMLMMPLTSFQLSDGVTWMPGL